MALDVDGTLFDGTGVDPAAIDALRAVHAAGHVVVNLTVKMLAEATADSLDTAATVERLRKAYGAATFSMTAAY